MVNVIVSGVPGDVGEGSVRCFQVENAHLLSANYLSSVLADSLDIPEQKFVLISGGHVIDAHSPISRAGEANAFVERRIRRALPRGSSHVPLIYGSPDSKLWKGRCNILASGSTCKSRKRGRQDVDTDHSEHPASKWARLDGQ